MPSEDCWIVQMVEKLIKIKSENKVVSEYLPVYIRVLVWDLKPE